MVDKDEREILERLIDKHGIQGVVSELSAICSEKAEHIAHNWQDTKLARVWMGHAKKIDGLTAMLEKT